MFDYNDRLRRAQAALRHVGAAGAVIAPSAQMRYLIGWAESGHERLLALLLPADGAPSLVVPAINAAQAGSNAAGLRDVRGWADEAGWQAAVRDVLSDWPDGCRTLLVDEELMAGHLLDLQRLASGTDWAPLGPLMAELRRAKGADELDALRRSAAVTDAVYEECLGLLRVEMTEAELQQAIADAYRRRGCRCDFAIVCFGPNSAVPHHSPGPARLQPGDVVIMDIGCSVDGYASDITRTVAFGDPGDEARHVYRIVSAAHLAGVGAGKPGVACQEVDRAARAVISAAGYGEHFIHRTGHGIGLSGHEPPYIVEGNALPLETGMCFSVEPGIYLAGRFGVRIENIVTVTSDGLESLNALAPTDLVVVPA